MDLSEKNILIVYTGYEYHTTGICTGIACLFGKCA